MNSIDRRWNLSIAKQQQGVKPPRISASDHAEGIIAAIDEAAGSAMVVVAFENHTKFVYGDDPNRLTELKNLMRAGGLPVGCIIDNGDGLRAVRLPPFHTSESVRDYLGQILNEIGARINGQEAA
jgi:hypothetical protein